MNLNSNKGKGLIGAFSEDTPQDEQSKLSSSAAKFTAFAEKSADEKAITKRIGSSTKEPYFVRSYRMSESNILKMDKLKIDLGSDFNFQINKALEFWFENVHPEVKI